MLQSQGLTVTEIRERKTLNLGSLLKPKVKVGDIAIFSRQFATMSGAGVPLTECLDILIKQTQNATLAEAATRVKAEVEAGGSLADALSRYPKIFSNLYVNMVRAGEASGALEVVFNQLANLLEKQRELRNKVKSALFLPFLVLGFCIIITLGLLIFIVPRFAAIFESVGGSLPAPTLFLVNLSRNIRGPMGLVAVGGVIAFVFLIKAILATERGGYVWDHIKLKLPLFGPLFTKKAVASFARVLALLGASGVSILESLDIVAETSGNRVIARAIKRASASIQQGDSISKPLGESKVFPPMVTHMIVVGENTGSIDTMLTKIAEFYEDEVDRVIEGLTKLIEPIMMVFVGAMVGGILVCLYLPIFNLAGAIGTE